MQSVVGRHARHSDMLTDGVQSTLQDYFLVDRRRTHAPSLPTTNKQKHMGARAQPFQANIRYGSTTILQYLTLTNIPAPCLSVSYFILCHKEILLTFRTNCSGGAVG